jgi:hypothetical protein
VEMPNSARTSCSSRNGQGQASRSHEGNRTKARDKARPKARTTSSSRGEKLRSKRPVHRGLLPQQQGRFLNGPHGQAEDVLDKPTSPGGRPGTAARCNEVIAPEAPSPAKGNRAWTCGPTVEGMEPGTSQPLLPRAKGRDGRRAAHLDLPFQQPARVRGLSGDRTWTPMERAKSFTKGRAQVAKHKDSTQFGTTAFSRGKQGQATRSEDEAGSKGKGHFFIKGRALSQLQSLRWEGPEEILHKGEAGHGSKSLGTAPFSPSSNGPGSQGQCSGQGSDSPDNLFLERKAGPSSQVRGQSWDQGNEGRNNSLLEGKTAAGR